MRSAFSEARRQASAAAGPAASSAMLPACERGERATRRPRLPSNSCRLARCREPGLAAPLVGFVERGFANHPCCHAARNPVRSWGHAWRPASCARGGAARCGPPQASSACSVKRTGTRTCCSADVQKGRGEKKPPHSRKSTHITQWQPGHFPFVGSWHTWGASSAGNYILAAYIHKCMLEKSLPTSKLPCR